MQEYEITYLVENEEAAQNKVVEDTIKNLSGETVSSKPWGQRNLAYPIGKLNTAFYVTVVFNMIPDNIRKLNRTLRLDGNIVRFLIIRGANEVIEEKPEDRRYEKKPEAKTIEIKPKLAEPKVVTSVSKPVITKKELPKTAPVKAEKPADIEKSVKKPTPVIKSKKEEASDEERLKQLENKLQDLLKE